MEETMSKLRVEHFPQIPCKPFIVTVNSLEEAVKIMDVLASYDDFQFKNRIKGDYCNATVLNQWDEEEKEWLSWSDEETGEDDVEEYVKRKERLNKKKERAEKE